MTAYQMKRSLLAAIVSSMMMIAACSGVSFGAQPPVLTPAQAAMFTPKPKYPEAAGRHRLMGKGIFLLNINAKTGQVTSIKVERGTGYELLDVAALKALIKWRFKPNTFTRVHVPVLFGFSSYRTAELHQMFP
jgi:TonB family protein